MTDKEKLTIALAALKKISHPSAWFVREAERTGRDLDGRNVVELSKDSGWLKSVAREALREIGDEENI